MFYNHLKQEFAAEAVEVRGARWFIRIGFAGFNSAANNRNGYETQAKAEAAVSRYQSR